MSSVADRRLAPGAARTVSSPRRAAPFLAGAVLALAFAWVATAAPELYRWMFALAIAAALVVMGMRSPRAAMALTVAFLPFLALVRRLLIADADWISTDPLLAVAPVVALFLLFRVFVLERRPLAPDRLSKLVLALLVLVVLQSLNPANESLSAGFGGLLFLGVPLLWFFLGRELADGRTASALIVWTIAIASAIGAYGLYQTEVGLPPWDLAWVDVNGFAALNVEDVIRAFGTFSSATEYAFYLAGALAFCIALALHGRRWVLFLMPLLAAALFLSSSRSALLLVLLAGLVVLGLRAGAVRRAVPIVATGVVVAVVAVITLGPELSADATSSGNALVSHAVGGIADPLNPEESTLLLHLQLVEAGFLESLSAPLGQGTGVTNIAADELGGTDEEKGTEVDVSDAFVSLGLVGGLLFLAVLAVTLHRVVRTYVVSRDPHVLAILGLLVVTLGGWLKGGHYALATLIWVLIGWTARRAALRTPDPEAGPRPAESR